jgi:membrane-bound lytic murein transglycosylase B
MRLKLYSKNLFLRIIEKLNTNALNRLASVALLLAIFPVSVLFSNTSGTSTSTNKTNIKLALDIPSVLASDNKISEIKPGESTEEKNARIQAENDAKAQAQAQAQADAKALALAQTQRNTVSREKRVYSDPSNFDQIYAGAASVYGVDASILKAIHTIETGASGSTSRSNPSGATGPMQFLPSTWRSHAVDGNGDGVKDIANVEDAIYTAAAYLKACGYPDVKKALWGYNPSTSYYNKVISLARSFGYTN